MLPTPVAMKHLELMLLRDDAQAAALSLAELEVLHPSLSDAEGDLLDEFPAMEFQEVFHRIQSRYKKIMDLHGERSDELADTTLRQAVKVPRHDTMQKRLSMETMRAVDAQMKALWLSVSRLEERIRQVRDRRSGVSQLQNSLQRFLSLDVDLSRVGHQSRFLNVRMGTIASANTARLASALSLQGYMLERFHSGESLDYVIIAGPSADTADTNELLKSADFRELPIPAEFSDRPQQVRQQLQQQAAALEGELSDCQREMESVIAQQVEFLNDVTNLLHRALPYASLATYLRGKGRLAYLQGWVPASRQQDIESQLAVTLKYPFHLTFQDPHTDQYAEVPTALRHNPLVAPFQVLVGQYGLPRYGEFDPGLLFALSYTLMFGMMFGDVGHGAVIAMLSIMLWPKTRVVAVVGGLAGLSSLSFGFVYGSVFGYEHLLHPLWMSPMHDPQLVLLLALYWGIGFLIIANLLAIRNMLVFREYDQAMFSPQGMTGFVFYLLAIYGLMQLFESDRGMPAWTLMILALLMAGMLAYQWRQSSGRLFERALVVLIEGLEFIISNVSATLSFLRVAAFTLNHIALAAAVFAIAAMLGTVGHWITIVLGNIFIIVLEGAIVAIQCLRLEYYEGFSRFFSGKGRRYEPLKTDYL